MQMPAGGRGALVYVTRGVEPLFSKGSVANFQIRTNEIITICDLRN